MPGDIPFLLPAYFLSELGAVIDMGHCTIMYMTIGVKQTMKKMHTGHVAVSIVEFGSGFNAPHATWITRSTAWSREPVPWSASDPPHAHGRTAPAMGPVATLVAAALCLQFPAISAGAHGVHSDASAAGCTPLAASTRAAGEGGPTFGSAGAAGDQRGSIFVSTTPGRSDDCQGGRPCPTSSLCEGTRQIPDPVPREEHPLLPCRDLPWSKQVWHLPQVCTMPADPENATYVSDGAPCVEPDAGIHPGRLLRQEEHQQGDQGKEESRGGVTEQSSKEINGLQEQGQASSTASDSPGSSQRRAGRSGRTTDFMARCHGQRDPQPEHISSELQHWGGCLDAGCATPSSSTRLPPMPSWRAGNADTASPHADPEAHLEVRQPGMSNELERHCQPGGTSSWHLPVLPLQPPGDSGDQWRSGSSECGTPVHLGAMQSAGLHVRDGLGLQEDGTVQHREIAELNGWLHSLQRQELLPETFMDLMETLELDVASTYVTTGCGECVKGVAPVSTWPTISRRVILTHNGEAWNAVSVSSVPGDNYFLGGNVHYLVLYEFMSDFLDYLVTAECDMEVTLTKPMKAEINQGLDDLLGDQTVYWNLWAEEETTDDVAEIYGSLQDTNDAIVELYSPPRVVEEARRRGLRAELSVDLCTGYDLKDSETKEHVRKELSRRKPKLLVSSPPCTKFSPFQNLRKNWEDFEGEWEEAVSHVDFSMVCLEDQRNRGGHGLHEHPDTATSWNLPSVRDYLSHDEIILVKGHQCRFGLRAEDGLNRKSTLFATSCDAIAVNLQRLCQCEEPHQQLVNGLPKLAEQYPPKLVQAIVDGFIQDWVDSQHGRPHRLPDRGDMEQWAEELGRQEFQWRQFHQSAVWVSSNATAIPRQGPGHRTLRWTWARNIWDNKWIQLERARSGKTPKLEVNYKVIIVLYHHPELSQHFAEISTVTTAEKSMVLRAHINLGHPSVKEFARLLKNAGTRPDVIQYVLKEFSCEGCAKEKRQPTRLPAATPKTYDFNVVIGVDLLFVFGADDISELPILNVTCQGTLYSTFVLVHPTRRSSNLVWQAFTASWLRTFGAPSFIIMDQGLEFMGAFVEGLENHGIVPMWIDRDAPYQNGITERRGGLFKEVYYKSRELRPPTDIEEVKTLVHEVSWALQTMTNRSGYSPAQRVLGKQPSLNMDSLSNMSEYEVSITNDAAWAKAEELRQAARKALMMTDSKERLQRAVRARPRRAREKHVFQEGEPVYVWRQGRRGFQAKVGPAFVILQKGDSVWVSRRGELWRCNRSQVFPMGNLEKQGIQIVPLELLKAKEKLRFHSEKLGFVDVEKEGDPPDEDDIVRVPSTPAPMPAGQADILRRVPQTPRGPPEGQAPRTPALPASAPGTPAPAPMTPALPRTNRSRSPHQARQNKPETVIDLEENTQASPSKPTASAPDSAPATTDNQPANDGDELWKATVENQSAKEASSASSSAASPGLRQWVRYDVDAKRFRASNSKGPLWGDVIRRITLDLDTDKVIRDETIHQGMTVHQIHQKLPSGVQSIETTLIYQPKPGHPDPGKPFPDEATTKTTTARPARDKEPEEDARLTDTGMKRSLEEPAPSERTAHKSRVFGVWRADTKNEWGDKTLYPVVANSRDIDAFKLLDKKDCYYALKTFEDEFPLHYLTKQGKELNEKNLTAAEQKLFRDAKLLEISNLVNSGAIELVTDPVKLKEIRETLKHRIMPSRFLITKKTGEIGESWKAKARWILLGHRDPDSLQLERFAPTPSTTTVMLVLQIIASHHYHLIVMDVSSAFGQSDQVEREQGPLYASMPPTGIPDVDQNALIHVRTAVYGLVNAPAVWRKTVRRLLLELTYQESVFDPCLYYLPAIPEEKNNPEDFMVAGVVLLDVDDFCQGGNQRHQDLMAKLRTQLKFGKWKDLYESSAEYIGRTLTQTKDFEIQVSMRRYIEEKLKPVTLAKDRLKDKTSKLTEQEITWLRGMGGSLLWIGKEARPDVGAACTMAMAWTAAGPTVENILMANKTVAELKQTKDAFLRVLPIPTNAGLWVTVADASMANVENKSQGGFLLAFACKTIMDGALADFSINSWRSHKLRRVVKATLGSEALAMDDALAEAEWLRALWHELLDEHSTVLDGSRLGSSESLMVVRLPEGEEPEDVASIRVIDKMTGAHVTDAKALYDLLSRRSDNAGQDRRAQLDVAVICVSARALKCKTFWVPGQQMIADPLTKRLGNSALLRRVMATAKYGLTKEAGVLEGPPEG